MSRGSVTLIGPLLVFARSKSRWRPMPFQIKNPWSNHVRSTLRTIKESQITVVWLHAK
jgi:hypothetical protein